MHLGKALKQPNSRAAAFTPENDDDPGTLAAPGAWQAHPYPLWAHRGREPRNRSRSANKLRPKGANQQRQKLTQASPKFCPNVIASDGPDLFQRRPLHRPSSPCAAFA